MIPFLSRKPLLILAIFAAGALPPLGYYLALGRAPAVSVSEAVRMLSEAHSADFLVDVRERREWIARVEGAARAGWLFRSAFRFESRYLSYGRDELESICERAGLVLTAFDRRAVFFTARMRGKPDLPAKPL
jgi:hypothetical protein